jgi:hypothetical protein
MPICHPRKKGFAGDISTHHGVQIPAAHHIQNLI